MIQRTLLIIKPDATQRELTGEILRRVEEAGFHILAMRQLYLTAQETRTFYHVHQGKYFFEPLVAFMSSGPVVPVVIEGEDAVEAIRNLVGVTNPEAAAEGTIRHDLGETQRRNSVHASDSPESAREEIGFFFAGRELVRP